MKRFARPFPFIVTRPPTQRYLIGQILDKKYAAVARQIFVRFAKSFLNGYAKNSGLHVKKRINLKAFVAFGVAGRALLGALREEQVAV